MTNTPTYPYLMIDRNGYRSQMRHDEVYKAFGLNPKEHLPEDGMSPIDYDGVVLYIFSRTEARAFWQNRGGHMSMRAMAVCPVCSRHVAASRLNQHARVHNARVRKGY